MSGEEEQAALVAAMREWGRGRRMVQREEMREARMGTGGGGGGRE